MAAVIPLLLKFIAGPVIEAVTKYIPDPQAKAAAQLEILKLQESEEFKQIDAALQTAQMQADINKVEAASPNWFIAGWRPAAGWVCVIALGVQYLIAPLATWVVALAGGKIAFPQLDVATLMPLLFGMLGLVTARSYDKKQGTQGNH